MFLFASRSERFWSLLQDDKGFYVIPRQGQINNTSLIVNQTGPCNHKFYALIKSDCKSGFYKELFTYLC